jgi:8-oxo-dGTP diphosphatase
MILDGQRVQPDRYTIIPRTLSFLLRSDEILLMELGQDRNAWSGKYNGIGGHIEAGEDPLSSARREIIEETGLNPSDLWLSGVVQIDTGSTPGIGLYIFTGYASEGDILPGREGTPRWVPLTKIEALPLVSDLHDLIPAALESRKRRVPFSALTRFDQDGKPIVQFTNT